MTEFIASGDCPAGLAEPRIITLDEAAEMLCCSYSTVLRLVKGGELKAFRTRRAWRTSTSACAEYISRAFEEQRALIQSVEVDHGE